MFDTQRFNTNEGSDLRFPVSLLFFLSGFALVLQNPQAQESAAELISKVEVPNIEQILEVRPQGPPPGVESDQLSADDGPDLQALPVLERDTIRSHDPRQRPNR